MLIELRIPFLVSDLSLSYKALISDRKMRRVLKLYTVLHCTLRSIHICYKHKSFPFFFLLMFVLEHVSPLHFVGKQNNSKCRSFCRVNIGGIRFGTATFDCWVRFSLTLPSETTVEDFIARQAPQTSSEESE